MKQQKALLAVPLMFALGCDARDSQTSNPGSSDDDATASADRFQRSDVGAISGSSFTPRSKSSAVETFIVELAGAPVARVQGDAGVQLSASAKVATRTSLAAAQAVVETHIKALGGTVSARYRDAYNGLRVRISTKQVAALKTLPGVVRVHRLQTFQQNNVRGAQRISAPAAWNGVAGVGGFRGEGIKVAIIDSGIDYTHADFGGPGTPEAYEAAFAAGAAPADPGLFGPGAAKVKGGHDFSGDDYDANDPASEPAPDENPLDCGGHGTHVAGSTAGFGVLANGESFSGPYNAATYANNQFLVGPGVAPAADLYALRVFGCGGSTNLVVDALDWAVAHDMDVINMSLGSGFGESNDPSAAATDNAVRAGIVVVASAGNSGNVSFITGSPASASLAISVAAQDPTASFPGVTLAKPGAGPFQTINANGAPVTSATLQVKVLLDAAGNISLGCSPADYTDVTGKLVVTKRGSCARVNRAIYGRDAGAAAVLMVNNAAALPPFEGPISANGDTGVPVTPVAIPFLGVSGNSEAAIKALDGQNLSLTEIQLANPGFNTLASFTSMGPRLVDGHLKPDVTAPGVSIHSAGIGSGNAGIVLSGTSMAAPHTAGLAALVRQAKPRWTAGQIKNAIVNTSSPGGVVGYPTRRAGAGVVDAAAAVNTQAIAWADAEEIHLNFGILEQKDDYLQTKTIRVRNRGTSPVSFNLTAERPQGSPHQVTLSPSSITVPANNTFTINVTVAIDTATSGDSSTFREAAGVVTLTPTGGTNGGATLTVPYYGILRPQSLVSTSIAPRLGSRWTQAYARVANTSTELSGTADFYAWGHNDAAEDQGYVDLRGVGVQSFAAGTNQLVVFAINTHKPWSTPSLIEFDVLIDSNRDGIDDFVVIGIDLGLLQGTARTGQIASGVLNLATGAISVQFLATAPTNGSTILLPVTAAQIGISAANPRFDYYVNSFDLNSADTDSTTGIASFNAFSSAVSQGDFFEIAPGGLEYVPVALNPAEQAITPALGHMIVTLDNKGGTKEATLIPVRAE
jgi:minor extracellular serine protease Vpr